MKEFRLVCSAKMFLSLSRRSLEHSSPKLSKTPDLDSIFILLYKKCTNKQPLHKNSCWLSQSLPGESCCGKFLVNVWWLLKKAVRFFYFLIKRIKDQVIVTRFVCLISMWEHPVTHDIFSDWCPSGSSCLVYWFLCMLVIQELTLRELELRVKQQSVEVEKGNALHQKVTQEKAQLEIHIASISAELQEVNRRCVL